MALEKPLKYEARIIFFCFFSGQFNLRIKILNTAVLVKIFGMLHCITQGLETVLPDKKTLCHFLCLLRNNFLSFKNQVSSYQ